MNLRFVPNLFCGNWTLHNHLFVESLTATFGSPQPPLNQSAACATETGILERLSVLRILESSW
jgi:hypothetical protein